MCLIIGAIDPNSTLNKHWYSNFDIVTGYIWKCLQIYLEKRPQFSIHLWKEQIKVIHWHILFYIFFINFFNWSPEAQIVDINVILWTGTMSDRQYIFLVFQKNYFGFLFEKKKEIGKPGNLKVGVLLTKIRKKISVCLILLNFTPVWIFSQTNAGNIATEGYSMKSGIVIL